MKKIRIKVLRERGLLLLVVLPHHPALDRGLDNYLEMLGGEIEFDSVSKER